MLQAGAVARGSAGLLLLALLGGCVDEDVDQDEGTLGADGFPEEVSGSIDPIHAYYRAQVVEMLDLGTLTPGLNAAGEFAGMHVHPLFRFTRDGTLDPAQLPVVDVIPPSSGYTPFFQIVLVELGDVDANDVKSLATLLRRDLVRTYTDQIVHCPLVTADATVGTLEALGDRELPFVELWYRQQHARCLALEGGVTFSATGLPAPAADAVVVGDRTTYTIPAQDVYIPEVRIFDEEVEVPGNIVTDLAPGDDGYSPVARVSEVNVKPTYQVGGFDELTDIDPTLISARVPETYLDLPVLGVVP